MKWLKEIAGGIAGAAVLCGVYIIFYLLGIFAMPAYGHTLSFKDGVIVASMRNASKGDAHYELAYQHKWFVATAGYYSIKIKGEEWLYNDSEGRGVFGNNQYRVKLHCVPITIGGKLNFTDWFYAGASIGYNLLKADRMYNDTKGWTLGQWYGGEPKTHNPGLIQLSAGIKINDRLSLEVTQNFSDLDIESGVYKIGIAEDKSNLNITVFKFVWWW